MQLSISSSGESAESLIIETGFSAGRRYRLETSLCPSPVCECKIVTLKCTPETAEHSGPLIPVPLEMDLTQKRVGNIDDLTGDPEALALAQAVGAEMSDTEWTQLRNIYFAVKLRVTEEADLEQLDVTFAPEVTGRNPAMVGYYEILPYARPIEFACGDGLCLLDDQYCVKPGCGCRETVLSFLPAGPATSADSDEEAPAIRYDYVTGRLLSILSTGEDGISDILKTLKSAVPDLDDLLEKRHSTLRQLYARTRNHNTVRFTAAKPGRNDRCPCGSGKKHKNCCGS